MNAITLQSTRRVVPMIYAYTTPEIARHNGWTKIGYTEQDVDRRIAQQTHTADVETRVEWRGNATFDDGSGETFRDTDFHAYLRKLGVQQEQGKDNEWFRVDGPTSHGYFYDFRANRGILQASDAAVPYTLRAEQAQAVRQTLDYAQTHEDGEFLWNAKPRFGKTLSVYDLCKRLGAASVLIVTNRPAIANSWYSDYVRFLGRESGYLFVSEVDALKNKPYVLTREEYSRELQNGEYTGCIEFVSLQDLKGSIYFGGEFDKLQEIDRMTWDVLVIDEAHEGVDTYKTDVAFNHISRKFTLHLSGTPFKALANDKFAEDAIFNWTYADEQRAKRDWHAADGTPNPYAELPKLNLFTYQMSEIVRDELEQGIEINGETEEFAFDLNEFFLASNGKFVHDSAVNTFLDALTTQEKFPFSTPELRAELKHTFWLLNRVESAKLLAEKLQNHPVFCEYKIVLAAGDGRLSEDEERQKAFDKVKDEIKNNEKTITLSVGQLTTGVTIPEWTAVLMLSSMKSPAQYMQAAFRAQNPCLFRDGKGGFARKQNAYVFDFDPARTLTIFEEFANDLNLATSDGRGDAGTRKENVRELLNFFPVLGEDEQGEMTALDAERVLSIPRKIRSREVVRRGFMSNYLFQNIENVFHAPKEVLDIITSFEAVEEAKPKEIPQDAAEALSLDENGEVALSEDWVIGKSAEVFGEKIFADVPAQFADAVDEVFAQTPASRDAELERLKETFHAQVVAPIVQKTQSEYQADIRAADKKRLDRKLTDDADRAVGKIYGDYTIQTKTLENERKQKLAQTAPHEAAEVNVEYDRRLTEAAAEMKQKLNDTVDSFVQTAAQETVRAVETTKREREKEGIEDTIRGHLRGFSRTIPSFLMAYGSDAVTLETFDAVIPDAVFQEVTGITLEQFRFLRDGGPYTDENGEQKQFGGRLFDPVVFNDSVREFMRKRTELANYFDESSTEDIFDYIPPQKTNQIFTPKWVVKKMVDLLEQENPGCFDDPDKTFIDLYMKSGLYITEIVKRLYRSEGLRRAYPDDTARLRHIFAKQVYGLAPTEIIYRIATNFILGFAEDAANYPNHLRQLDALPYAKAGTLEQKLDEVFGE